jgi:TRAP-type C4-dicarboxylate transport system permease small subunit
VLGRLDAALGRISTVAADLSAVGILLLMVATIVDVGLRIAGPWGVPGIVEYSEVVLVAIVFLGMGSAQRLGQHVATTVFTDRLPDRWERVCRVSSLALGLMLIGAMTYWSVVRAIGSVGVGEARFGVMHVPIWPARIALALGLVLLSVEMARSLLRVLGGVQVEKDPAQLDAGAI